MTHVSTLTSVVDDVARLERVGRFAFPVEELRVGERMLAQLGRDGALRMFFGRGRLVRLADGSEWRIRSTTSGRHIVPIITSPQGLVALSGPLYAKRSYGINGPGYGYFLVPLGHTGMRRPRAWVLRRFETDIATIDDWERRVEPREAIPLSAVLLAFALITHGIPGEASLTPQRD
jgi:hypothetical protein